LHRLWLAIGWVLVLLVVYLSLVPAPPTIDIEQGDKYGHILAFGTLMIWFAQLYAQPAARVAVAVGFVALGIGIEFAQELTTYRSFERADMMADTIGVALGWLAAPPRLPNFLVWVESLSRVRA
jgi:VanZ family protein